MWPFPARGGRPGPPPPPFDPGDPAEVARRDAAWQALADLYLDTELDDLTLAYLAGTLRRTGYTVAELEAILSHEVGPALRWNLRVPAGVWGAWGTEYVRQHVGRAARTAARRVAAGEWGGLRHRLQAPSELDTDLPDWRVIRRLIEAADAEA